MHRFLSLLALPALTLLAFPAAAYDYCREFTRDIVIDGQTVQGWGVSCLQPDGSWKISSEPQVAPAPRVMAPPPVIYANPNPTTMIIRERQQFTPYLSWSRHNRYDRHPGWNRHHNKHPRKHYRKHHRYGDSRYDQRSGIYFRF